ncbi:hypothetical protein GCM10009632_37240 [Mycolicibacterium alvei]|uniref:Uncharacterized protein n=1 Tax=Mycolicibacterium alvei TaxID=67081 RepID=A0A6N4UUS6_9MYCO|nr:hypothetical protein MALV_39410 [Mycolicibacterium alvei]
MTWRKSVDERYQYREPQQVADRTGRQRDSDVGNRDVKTVSDIGYRRLEWIDRCRAKRCGNRNEPHGDSVYFWLRCHAGDVMSARAEVLAEIGPCGVEE